MFTRILNSDKLYSDMNLQELQSRFASNELATTLGLTPQSVLAVLQDWQQPHRFYHTLEHLSYLLRLISKADQPQREQELLDIAALFHDAVYYPGHKDNEEKSAELFRKYATHSTPEADSIEQIILDTKSHFGQNELSELFCAFDLHIKTHGSPSELLDYERAIFLEFQKWNYVEYKNKRLEFLQKIGANHPKTKNSAWFLEGILYTRRPRIGIYPGTFSPFHIGHLSILEKAEHIFDKVIIALGINPDKDSRSADIRLEEVQHLLPFHEVIVFRGFLTDLIKKHEEYADVTVIRGLRNGNDLDYEVNQLRFMEELYADVRTMYLVCDKQYEHISSSAIRNLSKIDAGFAEKYKPVKYQYYDNRLSTPA